MINTDGSGLRQLTDLGSTGNVYTPAWAPDGRTIAFVRTSFASPGNPDPAGKIWVMNADGSAQRRVADRPPDDHSPAWSPDGTRIVFASQDPSRGSAQALWLMNADGSAQGRLTAPRFHDGEPSWQPLPPR